MSYTDDYAESGRYSKADQQRRLAQLLAAQGASTEPIASGWQGAAKLAQALAGVLGNRAADKRERAQQEALVQQIAGGLGMLGGDGSAAAPDAGPATTGSISGSGGGGIGSDYAAAGAKDVYQQWINKGLNPAQAAAFTASMQQESGFNPNANNAGEGAIGTVQWRGPRAAGLKAFAQARGKPWNDLGTQMDYALAELRGPEAGAGQAFFAARTPEEANQALKAYIRYGDKAGPAGPAGWDFNKRLGNTQRILQQNAGGGGETATAPGTVPVSDAPSPDVTQFLGMLDAQRAQGAPASPQDAMQRMPNVTPQMIDALRRIPQRPRGQYPPDMQPRDYLQPLGGQPMSSAPAPDVAAFLGQGTQANPRVVYPPPQPPQSVPNVGMGQLTGSGTRPPIPGGPAAMMTPAPIGRGVVAQPVPGTPVPTRPTVTGYPSVPGAPGPQLPSNDPMVQPSAVSPPDALGRTPAPSGPYAMPQPVPQGGHVLMAQQPPAPLPQAGRGLALLDPSAVPSSIDAPAAQAAVLPPQQDPRARAIQAVVQAQGRTDAPIVASAELPNLPRARPVAPLPSMPPGQLLRAPIQPPAAPVARTPVPRPAPAVASPVVPPAVGPARTAAIPQQRGQIFREPYPSVLSAQEFARQGQNYLTGRPSFGDQQRVAPRTMQGGPPAGASVYGRAPGTSPVAPAPVYAGAPGAAPAGAPVSPRQGLIQRLFGGGGGGGAAAPQAAPAGSAMAGMGQPGGDPQRMALARVLANPNLPGAVKAALIERFNPKPVDYGFTTLPDGTVVRTNPRTGTVEPTGVTGGKTTHVLSPQERAAYGISPNDPAVYQVDNTGKVDKVGGAGVNVTVGGPEGADTKMRTKLGEKEGESWAALKDASNVAGGMQQDIEALDALIKMAPQGPIIGPLAQAFPGFSNAGAAFQSIIKRDAPKFRVPGSGSTSDLEYQGMLDSLTSLSNRPEANAAILGMIKAKAELDMQRGELVSRFQDPESGLTAAEARRQMDALNRQSIMTPEMQGLLSGLETPQAQPTTPSVAPPKIGEERKGYRFKGGDPAKPDSWEPVT